VASALLLAWLWRSGTPAPSPKKREARDLLADLA
jgi:hypothetical protein